MDGQTGSVVRSRIIARQFATKSFKHLFAGTPDATALRATLFGLATDKDKVPARGGSHFSVLTGASGDRPVRASADGTERKAGSGS